MGNAAPVASRGSRWMTALRAARNGFVRPKETEHMYQVEVRVRARGGREVWIPKAGWCFASAAECIAVCRAVIGSYVEPSYRVRVS